MRIARQAQLWFVAGVCFVLSGRASAAVPQTERLIVGYESMTARAMAKVLSSAEFAGLLVLSEHTAGSWIELKVPGGEQSKLARRLAQEPGVKYVVRNEELKTMLRQDMSSWTSPQPITLRDQWALRNVRAADAWAAAGQRGRSEVTVAVIDTGADLRHLALASNLVPGYNFVDNNNDPTDVVEYGFPGHGTHCSGVIAANGRHQNGVIGVAPDTSVMPLKFISPNGGLVTDAIRAIDHAIANGARVISASWGGGLTPERAKPLIEAVARAEAAGIVFVTAAGNDGDDNERVNRYPANAGLANQITVAAVNSANDKPSWSNFGEVRVDIAAPGDSILSTLPGNRYATMSGTSMATPHVAGLAALLMSIEPTLTAQQVKALILAGGVQEQIEVACACRMDAAQTVQRLLARTPTLVPQSAGLKVGQTLQMAIWGGEPSAKWTWMSSAPSVVSVDSTGQILGLTEGDAKVVAVTADGKQVESKLVRVKP
jgi:thermitase